MNLAPRLAAAAICFVASLASSEQAHAGQLIWRQFPQVAQQEARDTGRPILIYVGADFCGYCRKLEQTTWADDRVTQTIDGRFVPLHVDGQRDPQLAARLGVRSYPAVIVLSPDGQLLGRVDGYRGPHEMQSFLVHHGAVRQAEAFIDR